MSFWKRKRQPHRMAIEEFAPAKLNLALHVTGRRDDGMHLLDSLICFADVGDRLAVARSDTDDLEVSGPFADGVPRGADNLIWKAASLFPDRPNLHIHLHKALPPASGIGGGTADAAAMIRAICRLTGAALPETGDLVRVGADLPVCVAGTPCVMRGVGEHLQPVASLPTLHAVLVNPGRPVSTGLVFSGLQRVDNPPMTPPPETRGFPQWMEWLRSQRNDLTGAATGTEPAVAEVLDMLGGLDGAEFVRMSGSGGTCVAIFDSQEKAADVCAGLSARKPDWWVVQTRLNVS